MTLARVVRRILTVGLGLLPLPLQAQGPEGGLPDPAKCVVYARAIETGHPAPFLAEARLKIFMCRGQVGHAYATWLDRLGAGTTRDEAESFVETPYTLRDGELFTTALRVAAAPGAPVLAREVALIVLLNQAGTLWSGPITAYERGQACSVAEVNPPLVEVRGGTPLPADYLVSASAVIDAIASSTEEESPVRAVALCVKKNLYRRVHFHSQAPPALNPTTW